MKITAQTPLGKVTGKIKGNHRPMAIRPVVQKLCKDTLSTPNLGMSIMQHSSCFPTRTVLGVCMFQLFRLSVKGWSQHVPSRRLRDPANDVTRKPRNTNIIPAKPQPGIEIIGTILK